MIRITMLSGAILGLLVLISCSDDPLESDTTPPTIVAIYPDDGAVDVPVDTTVSVTFSEPMNPATINGSTFIIEGVTGTVTAGASTAIFTPDAALDTVTPYTIVITPGVADEAGNRLAETHIASFISGRFSPRDDSLYFPLADGDIWYYTDGSDRKITRVVSGDTVINNLQCVRVLENDTTTEAWSRDSEGFYIHLLDKILWFDPPLKIPFAMPVDQEYVYASTVYWTINDTTYYDNISGTLKFKGYTSYSVPAGTFDSCLHFLYLTDGYNEYYAKNVGLLDNEDYVLDSAFVGGVWYRP